MILTKKQEEGLKIALERWGLGEKYTCIAGYAGTGKSTLVKFIIAAMDIDPKDVRYIAYTGKAATVLKNKGNPGAMTAHKLLYKATLLPNGRYRNQPRMVLEGNPKVIVVDEISMLRKREWDLLCSHNVYIIACGDPGQLPPVNEGKEDEDNHVLDHPHVFLDEIMRQAQDSEIIRLSMHVREGKPLSTFNCSGEQVRIFNKNELNTGMLNWADEILCSKKSTQYKLNNEIRQSLGLEGHPQIGDKVINLRNDWDFLSNKNNPLTNGVIGKITELSEQEWEYPFLFRKGTWGCIKVPVTYASIQAVDSEDEIFSGIYYDTNHILTNEASLTGPEEYQIFKHRRAVPMLFSYGYVITVWKAQGSEWDKVLLFEENGWPRTADMRKRYLYTGITRAVNKLVVIKK